MPTALDKLKANIDQYAYNPGMIQRSVLNILDEVTNGTINVVDPSNPFVFSLESAAVLVSGFMTKSDTNTRKQYAVVAQNQEDLYMHMSDKDYVGRFANPSSTTICFLMSKDELLNSLVEDTVLGIKKIVIPRNTVISVADTDFSLQYPIEIRQMAHGGIQVVYDTDIVSPLQTLSTNALMWEYRTDNNGQIWLYFEADAMQFNIVSQTGSLNASSGFAINIPLDDQFCYARVYHENANGGWDELVTTHTDQIFDTAVPTALIKVNDDKTVRVVIPQVYTVTGILTRQVRIDIYQTKGAMNLVLGNYTPSAFVANWLTLDSSEKTPFVAALNTFKQMMIYSAYTVSGGSNAVDFATLREQVINNSIGTDNKPITPDQLSAYVRQNGYTIVKNIDVVTNRAFVATKSIDPPSDKSTLTGISACIATYTCTLNAMSAYSGVKDNGNRITISSDAIFKMTDGLISQLTISDLTALKTQTNENLAASISSGTYLYSPFHYVLDASTDEFDLRAYYLDNPRIPSKTFVDQNDTALIEIATASYSIAKISTGYRITLLTQSGDAFKALDNQDINVQLSYYPPDEKDRAYIKGTFLSMGENGERYYQFDIDTSFDINSDDYLILKSAMMYNTEPRKVSADLLSEIDIFYTTTAKLGLQYKKSNIDLQLGMFALPSGSQALTQERIRVQFGHALNNLWKRARSTASTITYKTYDHDVLAFYPQDIYKIDANTGSIFSIPAGGGSLVYEVLHKKGDPILDVDGQQTYAHRKGDVVLDVNGKPIEIAPRAVSRQVDLFLLDGSYKFATSTAITAYRDNVATLIQGWITDELNDISGVLLEETKIYFYPRTTIGTVNVLVEDGLKKTIPAEQSFSISLYVPSDVYSNTSLKSKLTDTTVTVILAALESSRVSISDIVSDLKVAYGSDVLGISMEGLGGSANYATVTILDDTAKCSLRKKLVALASGELTVTEDVAVSFIRHSQKE